MVTSQVAPVRVYVTSNLHSFRLFVRTAMTRARHLVSHWWILTNPLFSLVEIHNIDTGRSNLRVINQRKRPMCLPGMSGNEIRSIATPNVGTREFRVKRVRLLSVAAPDAGTRVQKIVNLIHI